MAITFLPCIFMTINPNNPYNLSFPYPRQGNIHSNRGCLSCVHRTYCPAVYWFLRYNNEELTEEHGKKCESWSDDPNDIIDDITEDDLSHNDYIYNQGIGSESNRSGISGSITGSSRR